MRGQSNKAKESKTNPYWIFEGPIRIAAENPVGMLLLFPIVIFLVYNRWNSYNRKSPDMKKMIARKYIKTGFTILTSFIFLIGFVYYLTV